MNKLIKNFLLNEAGKLSKAKIGTAIATVAAVVLTIPTMGLTAIHVPDVIIDLAKIASLVGGGTAMVGFRDAITKK